MQIRQMRLVLAIIIQKKKSLISAACAINTIDTSSTMIIAINNTIDAANTAGTAITISVANGAGVMLLVLLILLMLPVLLVLLVHI